MLAKSRSCSSRNSGSCKTSGHSRSHSRSSSRSSGTSSDSTCSSSDSSCGHTVHVRKRINRHNGLQRRNISRQTNKHTSKRCNNFVSPHACSRSAYCHILKEAHCYVKRLQTHECCGGTPPEDDDDDERSAKKQKCQHRLANCSNCVLGRILPCSVSCGSSLKGLICNLKTEEMTQTNYNHRKNFCNRHGNHSCHHDNRDPCDHHGTRGPCDDPYGTRCPCENHLIPVENDCRSDGTKKIPCQAAVTNAYLDENLAFVEGHGLHEGTLRSDAVNVRNNFGLMQCFMAAKGKDSVMLESAKPSKPTAADLNSDDIKPGLTIPLTRDFGPEMIPHSTGSSQGLCHDSASNTVKGCSGSSQKDINVFVLDEDTDDEYLHAQLINQQAEVEKKRGDRSTAVRGRVPESLIHRAEVKKEVESSSTSVKKGADRWTPQVMDGEERMAEKNHFEGAIFVRAVKEEKVEVVERPESGWCGSSTQPKNFIAVQQSASILKDTKEAAVGSGTQEMGSKGFKPRKKRMVDKRSLPLYYPEEDEDESKAPEMNLVATVTVPTRVSSEVVEEAKSRMWEGNILCDLCHKGPSLSMGEWYAWCCGLRLQTCDCSPAVKMKLRLAISTTKSNKPKKTEGVIWSGMVHKMCALWSSEVYEEEETLQGLLDAVKRGKLLICASCKDYGATLGCRVKVCRRSFHYPCADELASKLCCRMWDGVQHPVACRGHRYVSESCTNAKEKPPNLIKWRFRGFVSRKHFDAGSSLEAKQSAQDCPQPKLSTIMARGKKLDPTNKIIDISSDSEDGKKRDAKRQGLMLGASNPGIVEPSEPSALFSKEHQVNKPEIGEQRLQEPSHALYHMGTNLLCEDISRGHEAVLIPCTNDVDTDPAPVVNYIIENRYLGRAKLVLEALRLDKTRAADTCKGCDLNNIDNPHMEASVHCGLNNFLRESDTRFDWQGHSMLGRLPYDCFGRLQLGPDTKDIVECNSRCPCGANCLNKELQRGLRTPIEVFKTKDRGWGVRTMEQICRGKFVVEYIGEVLTHDEAHVRGIEYDQSNFSCLFSADHPEVAAEDLLVIDGFRMSNVSRFINHSCDGNLRVYRVYTEITDLRFCRIGLYALRDIEIGEELSYDYGYVVCKDANMSDFSNDPTSIKCLCGANNCGKWLWTGTSR